MPDPFAALNKACVGTFGTAVTYRQGTAEPFALQGIVMKDSDEEQRQDARYARLFAHAGDFPSPPDQGDEAAIGGVTYVVYEVLLDPVGGAHLRLRAGA